MFQLVSGKPVIMENVQPSAPILDPLAAIAAFNNVAADTEFHSVSALDIGKPYAVRHLVRIDTTYGPKMKCTLKYNDNEDWEVILPSRLSRMTDAALENFNAVVGAGMPLCMTYNGKRGQAFEVAVHLLS